MGRQYYYFTFGCGQAHPKGYVKIKGTYESAREDMVIRFGLKWAFQYTEEQFLPQIERFGLVQVYY